MTREFAVNATNHAGWNVERWSPAGWASISIIYEAEADADKSLEMYKLNFPDFEHRKYEALTEKKKNGL
jgi:hypothetical protein